MSNIGISSANQDPSDHSDRRYDVFLSYRRSDGSDFARRLRRKLQNAHRILPTTAAPLRVYLDRIQARADLDFYSETVLPALSASKWLVVVATPDAAVRLDADKDWIAREINDFSARHGLDHIRVVHAAGDELPDLPSNLVAKMASAQKIDLRGFFGFLPAARAQEDWESLLATLFALGPEQMSALRREEERQARNRLARVTGAVAGAAVFATGLSGYAIYQAAASRNNVDRAATLLGAYADPSDFGVCDGLQALWDNGATRKPIPAMECQIARADALWYAGDQDEARKTLGTWEEFSAGLDNRSPDLAEELTHARHLYEMSRIEYRHNEATGLWLVNEDPLPPNGRESALQALDEIERSLAEIDHLEIARNSLSFTLWPLLRMIENTGDMATSRSVMERAAKMLEPYAQFNMEFGASPDDEWLLDYGLLARRIAFSALEAGDDAKALNWSKIAVDVFDSFAQTHPWALYQHGLARMVRGDVLEGTGANGAADFDIASMQMTASIKNADPDWAELPNVRRSLAYVESKRAP